MTPVTFYLSSFPHLTKIILLLNNPQFKKRYAGYQVPVLSLNDRELDLINRLTNVRIEVQGGSRRKTAVKVKTFVKDVNAEAQISEDEDADTAVAPDSEVTIVSAPPSLSEDGETSGLKTASKKPASMAFVNLVDILPPLPAKGNFSVETIRKSLYFFS